MNGGATQTDFKALVHVIEQTIQIMHMEQKEDETHKKWCDQEIATNAADLKEQGEQKVTLTQDVENIDSQLKDVNEEIALLRKNIQEIVDQRDAATKTRQEEQHNYDGQVVELREAEQALYRAIQVLQQLYGADPALLQRQGARARARGRYSAQQRALAGGRVAPPPDTWVAPYDGQEGGKNILQMLAEIGEDIVHQQAESEKAEKEAIAEYNQDMIDYESETRLKTERLVSQSSLKAKLELNKENNEADLDQIEETLVSLRQQQLELHKENNEADLDQIEETLV